MLKEGSLAIDFTLPDSNGNEITLSNYKGKKIVLYFYPKDMTSGCTKQACDNVNSHKKFVEKYDLPFLLLSDPDLTAIQAYDVWKEKKLYGKVYMGTMRSTYIIDESFHISKVFEKANPANNAQDILSYLKTSA